MYYQKLLFFLFVVCFCPLYALMPPKYVALTFDDGPSPLMTPVILSILKKNNIKATFFMLGQQVQKYPRLVQKVLEDGHEIGNHSYSHLKLSQESPDKVLRELEKTQSLLSDLGVNAAWFRPPYGSTNKVVKQVSKKLGMNHILWTVDSEDWRGASHIMKNIDHDLKSGGIVLMHDTKQGTSSVLPLLIDTLKKQDYIFLTLTQLKQQNIY